MDAHWKRRFAIAMAAMGEVYRQRLTDATLLGYELGLGDLPIVDIEAAIAKAIRSSKFMPTPAELRVLAGASDPIEGRAEIVWAKVLRVVRDLGYTRSVSFVDDPLVNATIRTLGGWVAFCNRYTDELDADKWLRKEFCDTYRALCTRGVPANLCGPLVGAFDAHNLLHAPSYVRQPQRIALNMPRLAIDFTEHKRQALAAPQPRRSNTAIGAALVGTLKSADIEGSQP